MTDIVTVECDRKLAFAASQHENWLRNVTSRKRYVESIVTNPIVFSMSKHLLIRTVSSSIQSTLMSV